MTHAAGLGALPDADDVAQCGSMSASFFLVVRACKKVHDCERVTRRDESAHDIGKCINTAQQKGRRLADTLYNIAKGRADTHATFLTFSRTTKRAFN